MVHDQDSGERLSDAFAHFDLVCSSWRTSQLCLFAGSIESLLTWPRAGIASRGRAIALPPLAPRIDETGSSSSLLPTITASEAAHQTHRVSQGKTASLSDITREVGALLPTCLANDDKGPQKGPRRQGGDSLCNLLPTATAMDGRGSRRATARTDAWTSNPGTTLTDVAHMLPTSLAGDAKGGPGPGRETQSLCSTLKGRVRPSRKKSHQSHATAAPASPEGSPICVPNAERSMAATLPGSAPQSSDGSES
jgi:hypothetical protein